MSSDRFPVVRQFTISITDQQFRPIAATKWMITDPKTLEKKAKLKAAREKRNQRKHEERVYAESSKRQAEEGQVDGVITKKKRAGCIFSTPFI
jgi:hypothetical protein